MRFFFPSCHSFSLLCKQRSSAVMAAKLTAAASTPTSAIIGSSSESSNGDAHVHSVDFEVFGKVQGVFFRKNTMKEAERLGLVGWVKNTSRDTVKGSIQGPSHQVEAMKRWLEEVGSPRSKIEKCVFNNSRTMKHSEYTRFSIRK